MLDIRKLEMGDVTNSAVIAINGDVTIDSEKLILMGNMIISNKNDSK